MAWIVTVVAAEETVALEKGPDPAAVAEGSRR